MAEHVVEVNEANFQQIVMEGSQKGPVVMDFWAPWCAPCRALGPILERLAAEYGGRFVLAKVNSDENPALAAQFGVRGIPSVKAVLNGELVDEFTGALPEPEVRGFIDRVLPSPSEELRCKAEQIYSDQKDSAKALELLRQAMTADPGNDAVRFAQARIHLDLADLDAAQTLLDSLSGLAQLDDRVIALRARLDLARGATHAGDSVSLRDRVAKDPADLEARLQLANLHVAGGEHREALDHLLEIVKRDRTFKDDIGRRTILDIFSVLGPEHELIEEYRRKLASALY